ncbi:MAG: Crp/Fnr family transcriptional regulator [Muribaculaceae bacterium]|nr:Crp/Fnr family transcriptional regulator [Muribaculaceae bacterium]
MAQSNFNTYIDGINADFWRELCLKKGELLTFNRGDAFVSVGEIARHLGYIKSGTLKYVALSDDGEEHVVGFEFAGEFVADFPFSLYGVPARVSIIAETPCEIFCVETSTVAEMARKNSDMSKIVMHATEALFSTVYDRYCALYTKTPQQRYIDLISSHPDIFALFSLKDIASFLNITPTHLSRLRKTAFKK